MATKQNSVRIENKKQWQDRIRRAAERTVSLKAFCESEGVSLSALKYWQRKREAFVPVKVVAKPSVAVPAVIATPSTSLPDPRWVAELIMHLTGGRR